MVSITVNKLDNDIGDENTVNDIVVVYDFTFNLNAERSGIGCGRSYTIIYEANDLSGNSATVTVVVEMPRSQ